MLFRSALATTLFLAGLALAAPLPYAPEGSAEALFDAGTPARANALAQLVRSPAFAVQAAKDKGAAAPSWLQSRLKADVVGGTKVRLTMGGLGLHQRQALSGLCAVVRVVAVKPTGEEALRLRLLSQQMQLSNERLMQLRGGRGGFGRGRIYYVPVSEDQLAAIDIRFNPPVLQAAPRAVR